MTQHRKNGAYRVYEVATEGMRLRNNCTATERLC